MVDVAIGWRVICVWLTRRTVRCHIAPLFGIICLYIQVAAGHSRHYNIHLHYQCGQSDQWMQGGYWKECDGDNETLGVCEQCAFRVQSGYWRRRVLRGRWAECIENNLVENLCGLWAEYRNPPCRTVLRTLRLEYLKTILWKSATRALGVSVKTTL